MSQYNRLMHTYIIGDLQGCCGDLQRLLEKIRFSDADQLWLVGDLVNRGPCSLETLRFLHRLGTQAVCVLGNHDLHLLAVSVGVRPRSASDTLDAVLNAPDRDELLDWLRTRQLAYYATPYDEPILMVHAGVLPGWSVPQVRSYAAEVEAMLRAPDYRNFLQSMYGNQPTQWRDDLVGVERLRVIINALTRLRFCSATGVMDLVSKDGEAAAPVGYMPWFAVPQRASRNTTIAFGHWSTLGLRNESNLIALDSGCVWGGQLTACQLAPKGMPRDFFQVSCVAHTK